MLEPPMAPSAVEPDPREADPLWDRAVFRRVFRLRDALAAHLLRLAQFLEAHPWISFSGFVLVVVPGMLGHSHIHPLWHDEFFTYSISQEPTISDLLRVNRLIDLVPPLSFLLTRASYSVFGVTTLSTRLPEMAGYLLAVLSVFLFVRHRAGTLYGLLASVLFYTGAALPLATEARPYGLLLGFGALGLFAWQVAREHRRAGVPLLLLAGFGMLLDHVFSVFLWGAFAAGEGLRSIERRKIDWAPVLAWIVPLVSVVTWIPLLRTHSLDIYPLQFQPSFDLIPNLYDALAFPNIVAVLCAAFALLVVAGSKALRGGGRWFLSRYEWVELLFILTIPGVVVVQLLRAHAAFFSRYAAPATLAISILGATLLAFWTRRDLRAALFCIVFALMISKEGRFAAHSMRHGHLLSEPTLDPCTPCALSAAIDPSLPLVDASGLAFVEMSHREDAGTLSRLYYLTDPGASTEYAHANIFEGMAREQKLLHLQGHVASYSEFIEQHHRFFVFGDFDYPEDWLLKKLLADGATLRFLGTFSGSYESHDLYEVTF